MTTETTDPLPEYLEKPEVDALLSNAPQGVAHLLMLLQWRAGLRIGEALALKVRDLILETDPPTLRVRGGKGSPVRVVEVHPELRAALLSALEDVGLGQSGRLFRVGRKQGDQWIAAAVRKTVESGVLATERRITSHTLRHSYARHLLANGIPINAVSRWLGHRSIYTTLVYLELLPEESAWKAVDDLP